MSAIYKKTITTTIEVDFIKCDKCGRETQFVMAIDLWVIIDGISYCYECQHKHGVNGYGEKKANG
jgi:hypothetical protein